MLNVEMSITDLDNYVDNRKHLVDRIDSGVYEKGSPEYIAVEEEIRAYNEQIISNLDPYISKYVLLFMGKLSPKQWTKDTYFFLSLLSGKKGFSPELHIKSLNWARRILRDYLVYDSEDSTMTHNFDINNPMDIAAMHSSPIYSKLVEITITILNSYTPRYKKENNERINFIHVFMVQFKYKLKQFIMSNSKDLMTYTFREDNTDVNSKDEKNFDKSRLPPNSFYGFETYEQFIHSKEKPWSLITLQEKEILWYRIVLKRSPQATSSELAIPVPEVKELYNRAISTIKLNYSGNLRITKNLQVM